MEISADVAAIPASDAFNIGRNQVSNEKVGSY